MKKSGKKRKRMVKCKSSERESMDQAFSFRKFVCKSKHTRQITTSSNKIQALLIQVNNSKETKRKEKTPADKDMNILYLNDFEYKKIAR